MVSSWVYFVTVANDILFAAFTRNSAETFAEVYNADVTDSDPIATVSELTVSIAALQRIPGLKERFSVYEDNELTHITKDVEIRELYFDGDLVSTEDKPLTLYKGREYIYLADEELWYLIDGDGIVLPSYDVEHEVEMFVDVEWTNKYLDSEVILSSGGYQFSRSEVFAACHDFLV